MGQDNRGGEVNLRPSLSSLWIVAAALFLGVLSAGWEAFHSCWQPRAPAPSGSSQSGTIRVRVVDSNRRDPYQTDGGNRELLLQFWYPTSHFQDCKLADYASPKVWAYLSQINGVTLPRVKTNSCLGAAVAPGSHPVIIFSHGYTGMPTDDTFLFEDLASRGYVVVSVAHTYETTAVEFPDGRLIKSMVGSFLTGDLQADDQSLERALAVRLADLEFVLNALTRLNSDSGGPFAGRLNTWRVGVMGHSLGGVSALLSLEQQRLAAAVMIDGPVLSSARITKKPLLILAAGRDRWTDDECRLWNNLRGPRLAVNLRGAEHLTPTDAVWLMRSVPGLAINTGGIGSEKTVALVRDYIAAFLDTNLLGRPASPLLNGRSPEYPEADVITQEQVLCLEAPSAMKSRLP